MSFDSVKTFNTIRRLEEAQKDAFAFICGNITSAPDFIREYETDFLACLERREEVWRCHYDSTEFEQKLLREIDKEQRLIEDSINQKMGALDRRIARLTASLRLNNYQLYRRL